MMCRPTPALRCLPNIIHRSRQHANATMILRLGPIRQVTLERIVRRLRADRHRRPPATRRCGLPRGSGERHQRAITQGWPICCTILRRRRANGHAASHMPPLNECHAATQRLPTVARSMPRAFIRASPIPATTADPPTTAATAIPSHRHHPQLRTCT